MTDDFPLIYCNGDSYSNNRYHVSLNKRTFAYNIRNQLGGHVIDKSMNGSCNRRIIRTAVSDLLLERKQNPKQTILALLSLTFEVRSEIWVETPTKKLPPAESNFRPHQFSEQKQWRQNLLKGRDIETKSNPDLSDTFYRKFSEGRAFFFSPYAERINLLCDLVMLRTLLDSLDIKFLVFQGPKAEKLQDDFLLNNFKVKIAEDKRFFDLETFGFCDWCHENNFVPLDFQDNPSMGHPGPEAHASFAEKILLPKLKETAQI